MVMLRVLAGPTTNDLTPISHLVNTYKTHRISSDRFDGEVTVHVKGFVGEDGRTRESAYFNGRKEKRSKWSKSTNGDSASPGNGSERKGTTWSIQVKGRFLQDVSSDDVLFGNTFDRPLRLPWGSGAALKFMHYVDPTLEHALESDRPWALSPLISTMPYFAITSNSTPSLEKREEEALARSDGEIHQEYLQDDTSTLLGVPKFKGPSQRRNYFSSPANRKQVTYHPSDTITTDFCYGFLSFPDVYLTLPGGLSFDLMKYWDGQPVRFVCCERKKGGKGPGDPFWVVVFEVVGDDEVETATGTSYSGSDKDSFSTGEVEVIGTAPQSSRGRLRENID